MKPIDKFNPAKWLIENKITTQSRLNEEVELKFKDIESGKTYKALTDLGIFKKGDTVYVKKVIPSGSEIVVTVSNKNKETDTLRGDSGEETGMSY